MSITRRELTFAGIATSLGLLADPFECLAIDAPRAAAFDIQRLRTPFKYDKLVLRKSDEKATFDCELVDGAFVFSHADKFYMTYLGYDGIGYQTGLASSDNLITWDKMGLILGRDPNVAGRKTSAGLSSILRDHDLGSDAPLKKVNGRFLGTWHAYPGTGYEQGAAAIGLAWSDNLRDWETDKFILRSEDGAEWERGGLYKSVILEEDGTYYLFYNAKNNLNWPWREQIGVATSSDLRTWKRFSGNPILRNGKPGALDDVFASDPFVVRSGKKWIAFYYGLSSKGGARDLVATGDTPFSFDKIGGAIVDIGAPGSIDHQYAHKPSVLSWNGDLYHFYTAVDDASDKAERGITVARSRAF